MQNWDDLVIDTAAGNKLTSRVLYVHTRQNVELHLQSIISGLFSTITISRPDVTFWLYCYPIGIDNIKIIKKYVTVARVKLFQIYIPIVSIFKLYELFNI